MRLAIVLAVLGVAGTSATPTLGAKPYHPKTHKVKKHKRVKHT
jgi:hypothetical protein